jgi:DNA-binding NarL/FixJ family response regulator
MTPRRHRVEELGGEMRVARQTMRLLSPLEQDIVLLAGEGMTSREIAYQLSIDTRLVRERLREILGPGTPARGRRAAQEPEILAV